jgi:hypothetical protein
MAIDFCSQSSFITHGICLRHPGRTSRKSSMLLLHHYTTRGEEARAIIRNFRNLGQEEEEEVEMEVLWLTSQNSNNNDTDTTNDHPSTANNNEQPDEVHDEPTTQTEEQLQQQEELPSPPPIRVSFRYFARNNRIPLVSSILFPLPNNSVVSTLSFIIRPYSLMVSLPILFKEPFLPLRSMWSLPLERS